jgi:agmatinase
MWNKNETTFFGFETSYDDAGIVLYGAPFDSTTSYRPGTRFASAAMRNESYGLETYSPYQDADLADCAVFDGGDLTLCIGDASLALREIERAAGTILADNKLPLLLGGEHLCTLGAVRAAVQKYPDIHILHFDAHADFREDYLGAKLSHATVMRRCHELIGDGRIFQFGIRSGEREEFRFAKAHASTQRFNLNGLTDTLDMLRAKPVYLTVDLDVLDPSVFPGTGTPEPGGIGYLELQQAVCMIAERCDIVGCDLVELSPPLDMSGVSTIVACKLLRELLLKLSMK